MPVFPIIPTLPSLSRGLAVAALVGLTACTAPPATGINDPHEADNRIRHDFNRKVDKAFVRPVGKGYAQAVPVPVQDGVGNFADNLGEPSHFLNHVLQGNVEGAARNMFRFLINSTFGLAGFLDPATELGIPEDDTDFGETMHVWGASEGAFVELPLLGPSTERDAFGKVVDVFTNPLTYALPRTESRIGTAASVMSRVGDRGRYSDTVDSILYDSADSYAQSRLIYLQNRRFELGGDTASAYDDPYASGYEDPYDDPYAQ